MDVYCRAPGHEHISLLESTRRFTKLSCGCLLCDNHKIKRGDKCLSCGKKFVFKLEIGPKYAMKVVNKALEVLKEMQIQLVTDLAIEHCPDEWNLRYLERKLPEMIDKFKILPEEIKDQVNKLGNAYRTLLKYYNAFLKSLVLKDANNIKSASQGLQFAINHIGLTYQDVALELPELKNYRGTLKQIFPNMYNDFCKIWKLKGLNC